MEFNFSPVLFTQSEKHRNERGSLQNRCRNVAVWVEFAFLNGRAHQGEQSSDDFLIKCDLKKTRAKLQNH